MALRTGGEILIEQLAIQGATTIFGVPGESFLAALDAFHGRNDLRFVTCRQEGGAAMMAEAWGKLTGKPGICFVTRGPGATNAASGVHVAQQDSTPMILLVGHVERATLDRDTWQEIDYGQMFGKIAKWVVNVTDPARLPEVIARAHAVAMAGRPGPVVVALPEDMLTEAVEAADAAPVTAPTQAPDSASVEAVRVRLERARSPLIVLGGGGWDAQGVAALGAFADREGIPVAVAFRRQSLIDNTHRCYAGHLGLNADAALIQRLRDADVLLVLGSRLGEVSTASFTLLDPARTRDTLIHVHPDPEELGSVWQPSLAICASPARFARALAALPPLAERAWGDAAADAHAAFRRFTTPPETGSGVRLGRAIQRLRERLPEDAIVTNGAGNYAAWVNRFFAYRGHGSQLAPCSGSMGYGVPAAVAAAILHPTRRVVAFAGDGCFLMTGQEIATARQYGAKILVVIVDNGMYGTIRMHQEREYPARESATALVNPDFAALGRAYGFLSARVEDDAGFDTALDAALAHDGPSLLHLVVDPEAITPARTLSQIRAAAQAAGR